jgi:hypothetical protein
MSNVVIIMPQKPKGFAKPAAPVKRKPQQEESIEPESKPPPVLLNLLLTIGMVAYGLFQLAMITLERRFEKKGDQ